MKKKPRSNLPKNSFWGSKTPIAVAHRGGDEAGRGRRNTLVAFKQAEKLGFLYRETDVVDTKDGKVIVAHGALTAVTAHLRGTFSHKLLQGMTYAQINRELRVDGQKIPLLEDLLTAFPGTRFLIDPKTDEVVLLLAKLINKLNASQRICVGSFKYDRVRTFLKLMNGQGHTSLIIGRGMVFRNPKLEMLKTGRLRDIEAVQLHHSLVSQEMVDLAHKQGLKVLIWTCNSPLSIKNALDCGADGVISDRIRLLRDILEAK